VHVALPVDLLEAAAGHPEDPAPGPDGLSDSTEPLEPAVAAQVLDALAEASRPLILVGPAMERGRGPEITSSLADVMGVPVVGMDGPRGANDPARGALAEVLAQADLILLLGKHLDFTLRSGEPPVISPACRFVHLDPDLRSLEQTRRIAQAPRLVLTAIADPLPAARQITRLGSGRKRPASSWSDEVRAAISYRPPGWSDEEPASEGPIHPRNVLRAVQELLDSRPDSVLISDGGEFGQWARACLSAPHSLINGLSGAIGSAVPFALAARIAFPGSIVVTVLGDGTFGFHPSEFDTAVRYMLPFIAVVGNDAAWNAEYQIQLREYGEDRLVGCELLPSRYDEVVTALGGHGEHVQSAGDLRPALERALRSSLPSCVNVSISRNAAPVVRRTP
jgi:acetolactate synthase-1/2/3 large subunit